MTDGRTYWYLDQTATSCCGHGEQHVYTDGKYTYVSCPVCDKERLLAASDTYYSGKAEQSERAKLSDKDYEQNLLQHGVIR